MSTNGRASVPCALSNSDPTTGHPRYNYNTVDAVVTGSGSGISACGCRQQSRHLIEELLACNRQYWAE
jgi:hypothetical protein